MVLALFQINSTVARQRQAILRHPRVPEVRQRESRRNGGFSLMDRTQGRVGDSIKVWYYNVDSQTHLRVVFEFCEGEHYYKYAGWKRIFSQYVLLDVPIGKYEEKKYHDVLADIIKVWYESHLKRDREIILKHIREKYEKG